MRSLVVLLLLASPALAEPQVHPLATSSGLWLTSSAELAKDLNARIAADMKLKPTTPDSAKSGPYWTCIVGYMTDALVSWRCEGGRRGDELPTAGVHRTFLIRGDKLVPFDLLAEATSKAAFEDAFRHGCASSSADPVKFGVFISAQGLEQYAAVDGARGCVMSWPTLYKALRSDGALATVGRMPPYSFWDNAFAEQLPRDQALPEVVPGKTAPTRFVAEGDYGVRDTQTGLVWAAKQSTEEVNANEAGGLALAYRGGARTDWRLPQIGELVTLATPDLSHTEPGDCTKGKSKYTITPLIHLACGLAWSGTTKGDKVAAFGFISGTPRLANSSDKKNYRALFVRGPN